MLSVVEASPWSSTSGPTSRKSFALLAHPVEQLICNHQVVGSRPAEGTKLCLHYVVGLEAAILNEWNERIDRLDLRDSGGWGSEPFLWT